MKGFSPLILSLQNGQRFLLKVSDVKDLHVEHMGLDAEEARRVFAWLVSCIDLTVKANLAKKLIVNLWFIF